MEKNAEIHRFVKLLCARRRLRTASRERVSLSAVLRDAKKAWHGIKLDQPDWGDHSYSVALGGELRSEGLHFHLILNAYWKPLEFEFPAPAGNRGDVGSTHRSIRRTIWSVGERRCQSGGDHLSGCGPLRSFAIHN